ncbi:MAG: TIGR00269 family protein [Candidatus Ranarchaeia archaeon]
MSNSGIKKKCDYCDNQAAIIRPESGESLCVKHFLNSVEKNVLKTIQKNKLLNPNDRIAVAFSGGKDSVALLHLLTKIEEQFTKSELLPFYVQEGISRYQDEALEIVKEHTKSLDLPLKIFSFKDLFGITLDDLLVRSKKLPEKQQVTPCTYCGILRRWSFNTAAKSLDADVLATGHTLDDEAQTVLMNIMRGDLYRIVRTSRTHESTPKKSQDFIPRVKPLQKTTEREVVLYNYYKNLRYQVIECPHRGAALRNPLRTFLNEQSVRDPTLKYTLFNVASQLSGLLKIQYPTEQIKSCKICGGPTNHKICKKCQVLTSLGIRLPDKG